MNIIYLGYIVPDNIVKESRAVSVAGNNMEKALLKNLYRIYGNDLFVISVTPRASFPRSKMIVNKRRNLMLENGLLLHSVGYINIPFIKQLSIMISILSILMNKIIMKKNCSKREKTIVMTYNSASILSLPVYFTSMFAKFCKICLVVDIPITFQKKRKLYFMIAKGIDNFISLRTFKKYDGMVTLVERTVLDFAPLVPYKLINYSLEKIESIPSIEKKLNNKVNIVFTGALEEYYGVKEMVDLIESLPSNYYLNLYGKGSLVDYIDEKSKKNKRIIFHGLVANDKAIEAQTNASLLLLIRTNEELNKYGLPSKIIEYLASGTPIISTKISSIPNELHRYINFIDNNTPESILSKVISITSDESVYQDYLIKAKKGREYIINNFTWEKQAESIRDFINELVENL
ncbi:glycosyltransferase [Proteiniborus sp. MB09-C3]|uniref:glycosyltransferase n=1 Tax=Proteiniborus sp. MB09-C3 TaxID=3050072 RepID=UPI002555613A|nr:glycosyltransferase [Proteiniborus sp. MB09-C3]WIV12112.1 glycosyltransferase [Proteiniborus sp. MB09-C3]